LGIVVLVTWTAVFDAPRPMIGVIGVGLVVSTAVMTGDAEPQVGVSTGWRSTQQCSPYDVRVMTQA